MKFINFTWNHRSRPSHRNGFTLIEVLVCITIIAVLIALLIPAVQASREAARRSSCLSNMRQLGLALNSYQASLGVFPPPNNANRGFSPFVMILPHLEQAPLYSSVNFGLTTFDQCNATVASTQLKILFCPSDTLDPHYGGWTNYACNTGYGFQLYGKFNGAFTQLPDLSSTASFTDGTTSTAMIAEWVRGSGMIHSSWDRLGSATQNPGLVAPDQFDQAVSNCINHIVDHSSKFISSKGWRWIQSGLSCSLYNHNIPVNGLSCTNGGNVMEGSWTASSRHSGGANVLFADGHVQYIRQTISIQTWRALGTRAGAEAVSASDY